MAKYIVNLIHDVVSCTVEGVCPFAVRLPELAMCSVECDKDTAQTIRELDGVISVIEDIPITLYYDRPIDFTVPPSNQAPKKRMHPFTQYRWGLGSISDSETLHKWAHTGRGVDILVADSGVNPYNQEFKAGPNYDWPEKEDVSTITQPLLVGRSWNRVGEEKDITDWAWDGTKFVLTVPDHGYIDGSYILYQSRMSGGVDDPVSVKANGNIIYTYEVADATANAFALKYPFGEYMENPDAGNFPPEDSTSSYVRQINLVPITDPLGYPYPQEFEINGVIYNPPEVTGRVNILLAYWVSTSVGDINRYRPTTLTAGNGAHGTAVASNAAGLTMGFAHDARIISLGTFYGFGHFEVAEAALEFHNLKKQLGVDRPSVMNMSYGIEIEVLPPGIFDLYQASIDLLAEAGIVCVAAHGNNGYRRVPNEPENVPAGCNHVVSAAACNQSNNLTSFTAYGGQADLFAPGEGIQCAGITSNTGPFGNQNPLESDHDFPWLHRDNTLGYSGTSFSSPFTAGVIACALEYLGCPMYSNAAEVDAFVVWFLANYTRPFNPTDGFPQDDQEGDGTDSPNLILDWGGLLRPKHKENILQKTVGLKIIPDDNSGIDYEIAGTNVLLKKDSQTVLTIAENKQNKYVDQKDYKVVNGVTSVKINHPNQYFARIV